MRSIQARLSLALVLALPALLALCAWLAAGALVSPPRRTLQPQHREWLDEPAAHGIRLRYFACLGGSAGCLLVEPDAQAGPASRGSKLRAALAAEGVSPPSYGRSAGILVLLHGRASRKEDLLPVAERFAAAGFRCLIPDLPGHGEHRAAAARFGSGGGEAALPAQVLQEARQAFGLPEEPAGLFGLSMGAAYAVRAAAESPHAWKALVLAGGFDALDAVVADALAPRLGPLAPVAVASLSQATYRRSRTHLAEIRPAQWARRIELPVLVLHGADDAVVPPARGRALFRSFSSRHKRWLSIAGAGHHTLFVTAAPVYPAMAQWYLRWMRPGAELSGWCPRNG